MICPKCQTKLSSTVGEYRYRDSGLDNVWIDDVTIFRCRKHDLCVPVLPNAEKLAKEVSAQLICVPRRLDGDSILFLRKVLKLTGSELAEKLRVHRVEVSRWENDRVCIDLLHDLRLRRVVADSLLPPELRNEVYKCVDILLTSDYLDEQTVSASKVRVSLVPKREAAFAGCN